MDDLFPLLMFLIFVLGPILEGIKRKNKQPPPPPPPQQRRMPQPPPRQAPAEPSRTEEISSRRTEESAAGMVPNDLWEILTGQKPLPPVPTTSRPPAPVATKRQPWDVVFDPDEEDEESGGAESAPVEQVKVDPRRERGVAQSLESLERHPVPVVVSLEDNIPTTRQRHDAFHKKVAPPITAPKAKVPRRPVLNLKDRSELQRAMLTQDILGKPKGLE
jgi:hypothetical protein